ncbi:MAG: GHKL domain-containing protein [Bdellovibrionaceae bacterium]|nr:GHKL domain-containing protein [Pseudobdellovibrionaceae bacterium]
MEAHHQNYLLWIIDLAPFVLGVVFYFIGIKRGEIIELNNKLKGRVEEGEEALLETQEALVHSARLSALGEMSAGIAHEINNPLAIIGGYVIKINKMIKEETVDNKVLKFCVEKQQKSLNRIQKIVSSLRKASKDGEADPFEIVNVKDMVDEAMEFGEARLRNHDISFSIENASEDIEIEGQFVQLTQVILNLVNNAHDAIFEMPGDKWIKLVIEDAGEDVLITLRDSGLGIPEDIAEKILEPFFTTKAVGSGTGLGLSLCNGIIMKHQGEIKLNPECVNTEFIIRLPKKQKTAEDKAYSRAS